MALGDEAACCTACGVRICMNLSAAPVPRLLPPPETEVA